MDVSYLLLIPPLKILHCLHWVLNSHSLSISLDLTNVFIHCAMCPGGHLCINFLSYTIFREIFLTHGGILIVTDTTDQEWTVSIGNKKVLRTLRNSRALAIRCNLVPYTSYIFWCMFEEGYYLSARDSISVFYSLPTGWISNGALTDLIDIYLEISPNFKRYFSKDYFAVHWLSCYTEVLPQLFAYILICM